MKKVKQRYYTKKTAGKDNFLAKVCHCLSASFSTSFSPLYLLILLLFTFISCARMGEPDGGWYDETPPKILGTSPANGSDDVNSKKVTILFNEFVKLDNPTEKVVVSPPTIRSTRS